LKSRGRLTEPGEGVGRIILQPTPFSQSVLESLQRSEISNLPAFRAKIAEAIMSDDMLKNVWLEDLKTMSGRIAEMRRAFSTG
jgi:aspartate aminotransferase